MRDTRRCDGGHSAVDCDQPSNGRTPSSSVEIFKQQKSGNNRCQADEVLNRESDRVRLSKPQAEGRIPDDQDSCVEYGKQTEPEQKSFAVPPPEDIERDRSDTERCNHVC